MSTLRTISGFKSALAGGGARPNLFEVSIDSFPDSISSVWTSGSIRYKVQMADKNSDTSFVNRVSNEADGAQYPRSASSITVMEVAP